MNDTMQTAMNEQIRNELGAAYTYLAMSAYFEAEDLPGMAHWMRLQSQEEIGHAMKFYEYIHDRSGRVTLHALDQPPAEWGSPLEAFQAALAHEKKVSGQIHHLYDLAVQDKDYPSQVMLNWFVEEQVEEEKSAGDIVAYLEKVGGHMGPVIMLDRQLASRGAHGHGH